MIWPMKAGSVLLGKGAAEASDQGVQRGADEVEGGGVLFSISELMISIDCEQLLAWVGGCRQDTIFYTRISPFTPRHLPHS